MPRRRTASAPSGAHERRRLAITATPAPTPLPRIVVASRVMAAGYRVGVDVGGTFTDLLCVTPSGDVVLDKIPTTTDDQSTGVMGGLALLADRFDLTPVSYTHLT